MKRVGHLMPKIADMENLREAFLRASRGKTGKMEVKQFRADLDQQLNDLHRRLLDGTYTFGQYRYFDVCDPKKRTICAAAFDERVVQHAMIRIVHPVFDRYQIDNSFACRIGKGGYKAIERAQHFARRSRFFQKLDVCKFFNTIDHNILMAQMRRLFKDKMFLDMLDQLIGSYEIDYGRGLPIGNLSSQYFANHYLSTVDHHILERLHPTGYVRYMDDMLLFDDDSRRLQDIGRQVCATMADRLGLQLHTPVSNRCAFGIPFLGYVVYPYRLRLNQRSRHRFRRRVSTMQTLLDAGVLTQSECQRRYNAMYAFVEKADARAFINRL